MMNKSRDGWYAPLGGTISRHGRAYAACQICGDRSDSAFACLECTGHRSGKSLSVIYPISAYCTTACTAMEHTLQQARHTLGYYRSQKYWQDDLRAYQDPKYDAVRAFSFEKSGESRSFSKAEGEYPYPYKQRQREWERFWTERLEEAKPTSYAGAGTYRYPYLNLETGKPKLFQSDLTVTVPHPFHREFLKRDAENQFPSLWRTAEHRKGDGPGMASR